MLSYSINLFYTWRYDAIMKKNKKLTKDLDCELFCPGYKSKIAGQQRSKFVAVAEKFIKIMIAMFNEIERFSNTEEFKDQIILALVNQTNDLAQACLELIKKVKVDTLKERSMDLIEKMHLKEFLNKKELDQLVEKIISSYKLVLESTTTDPRKLFEEDLRTIVRDPLNHLINPDYVSRSLPKKYHKNAL